VLLFEAEMMNIVKKDEVDVVFFEEGEVSIQKLYDLYFCALCAYANRYVNDKQVAGDLVQEVYIKVWKKRKHFETIIGLRSFMYLSIRNASLNYLRDHVKMLAIDTSIVISNCENQNFVIEEEVHLLILKEVAKLPEGCKNVFQLTLLDMSIAEISECLQISKNTVRNQRSKARRLLKSSLGDLLCIFPFLI